MRWLLWFGLVCLPVLAAAKPKVAVAPLDGDRDGKVAEVVADVAGDDAKVTGPGETGRAIDKLGKSSSSLDGKTIAKVRKRLGVDALIHGKVEKNGSRKLLELEISVRGKKTERFSISFNSATDKKFKRDLRDELSKRMSEGEGAEDDDDEEEREKQRDTEKRRDRERTSDDDEDRSRKKRKKRRGKDDAVRDSLTQAAVRVSGGGSATRRTFTYDSASPTPPRRVGTVSGSARAEGELYPGSFDTLEGLAASLGIVFEVDKTFGLAIPVPGAGVDSKIDKLHYAVGVRYRVPFGTSSIAFGASYYHRRYAADRGSMATAALDMPDVKYTAVAPGAVGRFLATPKIAVFVAVDVPLMLDAGPIQNGLSYGAANIIAVDADAGIDYRLGANYAIKAALEVSNIALTFDAKPGTQAATRMVSAATDRNVGLAVTLELLY